MRKSNFFKNALFKPSVIRNYSGRKSLSLSDHAQDAYGFNESSGSFKFDPAGSPLKNTQQLNVDFSKFENHTFFNSARNKVHIAFEKVINQFPFDGTRKETDAFFQGLNGFEKYIFDSFPKNTGFLIFDRDPGSNVGNFLSVTDYKGSGNTLNTRDRTNDPVLSINSIPFSIECSLYVPSGSANKNEVIAQRINTKKQGFTLAVSSSEKAGLFDVMFVLSDETKSQTVKARNIEKGKFVHVAAVYDRKNSEKLKILIDGQSEVTSSGRIQLSDIDFAESNLTIGSGSSHTYNSSEFLPEATLSGSIDDFRFFNSARTTKDIRKYMKRELFAQSDLKLYFRFNEPSGSFGVNTKNNQNLCLDHSGNELHTFIQNFSINQRDNTRISARSLVSEDPNASPILFPTFESVRALSQDLLLTASNYDINNPNLITKLVPSHFLEEEREDSGRSRQLENLDEQPGVASDQPGGNRNQQSQLISSVLFLWADFFDDIKLFVDELSRVTKVDYKTNDTISSQLLPFLARYHSFNLPSQFNNATVEQFAQGRNVTVDDAVANKSLQEVQNTIWRRILSDLPEIRRTKGTRSSVEAVLRNIGINPGTTFRIKEYGGNPRKEIGNTYLKRTRIGKSLVFTGSLSTTGTLDGEGRDSKRPLFTSAYLSASRTEPGIPNIRGSLIKGQSNNRSDGFFTSGSWTVEGMFKLGGNTRHKRNQSLLRIQTTGSYAGSAQNFVLYNLICKKPDLSNNTTGSLILFGKPSPTASSFRMEIQNIDIFDGSKWHLSFGRDAHLEENHVSSSYFLRAGKSRYVSDPVFYSSSVDFYDKDDNAINNFSTEYNANGPFLAIGSMSLDYSGAYPGLFLNSSGFSTHPDAKILDFSGEVSKIRFFTKALTKNESLQHVGNPFSLGVTDPSVNFGFSEERTGSFQRLRIDYSLDQIVTQSSAQGEIQVFDFTQNQLFGKTTGLEPSKDVVVPTRYDYRTISPKLDTKSSENKVRIRSFKSSELADTFNTGIAPVYEIPPAERPFDDRRVEIEVSTVQALNDDIVLLFSTLDYFDNAIGDPNLVFSNDYVQLRDMRRIYFNRLNEKMSLTKFFSFFKWFDDTVGDILEDIVPRTSRYLGTNFVIESHSLERAKFPYMYADMYLGELERPNPGEIYVQQLIGKIKRR